MTRAFVRKYALFGRSRPRRTKVDLGVAYWGTRKGTKLVRAYHKGDIAAFRIEFELHSRFLRNYSIDDVFDFRRLVGLLLQRHIFFGRIDEQQLVALLRRSRTRAETSRILQRLHALEGDLAAQLGFLRRGAGLKNTRRLLTPLRTNRRVRDALEEWSAMWPSGPGRF